MKSFHLTRHANVVDADRPNYWLVASSLLWIASGAGFRKSNNKYWVVRDYLSLWKISCFPNTKHVRLHVLWALTSIICVVCWSMRWLLIVGADTWLCVCMCEWVSVWKFTCESLTMIPILPMGAVNFERIATNEFSFHLNRKGTSLVN